MVRAVLQNGLLYAAPQRLWYMGPMFRRERPQKGRTRQFHQVGAEVFGAPGPDIDAELEKELLDRFLSMHLSEDGIIILEALGIDRFELPNSDDYDRIRSSAATLGLLK